MHSRSFPFRYNASSGRYCGVATGEIGNCRYIYCLYGYKAVSDLMNTSSVGSADTFPSRGRQGNKSFPCRSIIEIGGFSDRLSTSSCGTNSLPLEGKVGRRYTYDQPSQEIIGLTHERQHEASVRTGRAPSTGEPDEVSNCTPDMRNANQNTGVVKTFASITFRAGKITTFSILNANRPCAEHLV